MATELTPRELTAEVEALKRQLADQDEVVQRALSIASHHAPEHFFEGNDALRPHIAVRHNSGATEVGRRPRLNFLDTETGEWTFAVGTTEGEDEIDISLKATGGGFGFCYDYLVMSGWTGTEGQTITIPDSTETFQVYSTIGGAISAANTANTAGKTFSIGVCPATYNESISWPNSTAGNTYSALLIRGLGASDSHDDFDQVYWSTNQAGVSPIELDATNPVGMQIENIVFNAVGGQPAIDWSAGINLSGHAINCEFRDPVEMETAGFWFHHCLFSADFDGEDSDDVFFIDCKFGTNAGIDLSSDTFSGVTVIGCDFVGGTSPKIQLTAGAVMNIIGNTFTGPLSSALAGIIRLFAPFVTSYFTLPTKVLGPRTLRSR